MERSGDIISSVKRRIINNNHFAIRNLLHYQDHPPKLVELTEVVNVGDIVYSWARRNQVGFEYRCSVVEALIDSSQDNWIPDGNHMKSIYRLFDEMTRAGIVGRDDSLVMPSCSEITPHYPIMSTTDNINWAFMGILPPIEVCLEQLENWLNLDREVIRVAVEM